MWRRGLVATTINRRSRPDPGDVLFYPRKWFHQTLNLDTLTVGIAGRRVDATNYLDVHTHFKRHCSVPQRNVPNAPPLQPATCARIDSCLQEWRDAFDHGLPAAGAKRTGAKRTGAKRTGNKLPPRQLKKKTTTKQPPRRKAAAPPTLFAGSFSEL
jgi:hypothetical protein